MKIEIPSPERKLGDAIVEAAVVLAAADDGSKGPADLKRANSIAMAKSMFPGRHVVQELVSRAATPVIWQRRPQPSPH